MGDKIVFLLFLGPAFVVAWLMVALCAFMVIQGLRGKW